MTDKTQKNLRFFTFDGSKVTRTITYKYLGQHVHLKIGGDGSGLQAKTFKCSTKNLTCFEYCSFVFLSMVSYLFFKFFFSLDFFIDKTVQKTLQTVRYTEFIVSDFKAYSPKALPNLSLKIHI